MESSLYTALTRTAEKLIIIKPNTVPIENNQDVFQLYTPTPDQNLDAAVDKDELPKTTEEARSVVAEGAPKTVGPVINGATIDPKVKQAIDDTIKSMKEYQANGFELSFPATGFGQYMIGADDLTGELKPGAPVVAQATFVYLSEQLYKNFKYVNPNFDKALYGEKLDMTQEDTPVSDDEVRDALSFCFK